MGAQGIFAQALGAQSILHHISREAPEQPATDSVGMGMLARFTSPLVLVGGLALVLTILMAGFFLEEQQACGSDEPLACTDWVGGPSDTFLEKRSDEWLAKYK